MTRRLLVLLLTALLATASFACSSDGEGAVADRLRSCGLLSAGEVGALPFYAPTSCYRNCLRRASCGELAEALCRSSIALLSECDRRCAYMCDDGSLIGVELACDGVEQCADGSDEASCPGVTCPDGTVLEPSQRCNGVPECADGTDEAGCTLDCASPYPDPACPPVACDDGSSAPAGALCNGWEQCADGSDEAGCAELTLTCPEG